ncbi:hypothetical protein [Catellatospora sp. NPDC049609]|uniref:hypothetical protein n=1 Tax=Catellatospora sp. NPDC049609 TaxID=3155505 RepID=UPI00343BFA43
MPRTWPSALVRAAFAVPTCLFAVSAVVWTWSDQLPRGETGPAGAIFHTVGMLLVVELVWRTSRTTLTLTDQALRFRNGYGPFQQVRLSDVRTVTVSRRGLAIRLTTGEVLVSEAVVRIVLWPWRRRPRTSEQAARLINEAIARRARMDLLLDGVPPAAYSIRPSTAKPGPAADGVDRL